jgi:hypothetical protein
VTFHQHIAAVTVFPAVCDPDGARMRGMSPAAMDPDVAVAIPAMIAIDPHPAVMRWMIVNFNDWFRRRDADIDLRHCNRGDQTKTQEQRKSCLLHRKVILQGLAIPESWSSSGLMNLETP